MERLKYLVLALLFVACEKQYDRPDVEWVNFDGTPRLSEHITVDESVDGVNVLLSYQNGGGNTVEISIKNTIGIYAESMQTTLKSGSGEIELPLKGSSELVGLQELSIIITYDLFTIIKTLEFGIRPLTIDDIEVTDTPTFEGALLRDIDILNSTLSIPYINGWGREAVVTLTSSQIEGFDEQAVTYILQADDAASVLQIPLSGRPLTSGSTDLTWRVEFEDLPEAYTHTESEVEVNEPVPYEEEEVTDELIITDRNILMVTPEQIERKTFTYKTIFVDMNGDGYVSGNHEIWLDRNVGATSTDPTSLDSYGFRYQGARNAPGFIANSQNDTAGNYYKGEDYSMNAVRWYNGEDVNKTIYEIDADGVKTSIGFTVTPKKIGPSTLCPEGFRPPTQSELLLLVQYLGTTPSSYTNSVLKLPFAGGVLSNAGANGVEGVGSAGYYYGAPIHNGNMPTLEITTTATVSLRVRGASLSIRCVKANSDELP